MKLPRPSPFAGWTVFLLTIPIGLYYGMHLFGMAFHSTSEARQSAEFLFWALAILNPVGTIAAQMLSSADSSYLWSIRAFCLGGLISPLLWAYLVGWLGELDHKLTDSNEEEANRRR